MAHSNAREIRAFLYSTTGHLIPLPEIEKAFGAEAVEIGGALWIDRRYLREVARRLGLTIPEPTQREERHGR